VFENRVFWSTLGPKRDEVMLTLKDDMVASFSVLPSTVLEQLFSIKFLELKFKNFTFGSKISIILIAMERIIMTFQITLFGKDTEALQIEQQRVPFTIIKKYSISHTS
jgi:hypothetical protein